MSDKLFVSVDGKRREMNEAEKAQHQRDLDEMHALQRERAKKDEAFRSAITKLKALGLTDAEIAALIGG